MVRKKIFRTTSSGNRFPISRGPVPRVTCQGNPRLPSLSPYTGSRLPGLTRQGGKHTLQRPKTSRAHWQLLHRERERESFIRNNLHNGVVSGAARGQALLGPMWAGLNIYRPGSCSNSKQQHRSDTTPPSPNPLPAAPHSARVVCRAIACTACMLVLTRVPGPPIGVTRLGSPASPRLVPVAAVACRAYRDSGGVNAPKS